MHCDELISWARLMSPYLTLGDRTEEIRGDILDREDLTLLVALCNNSWRIGRDRVAKACGASSKLPRS